MAKLTHIEREILQAAAQGPDGLTPAPPVAETAVRRLIEYGLMKVSADPADERPLRITETGLALVEDGQADAEGLEPTNNGRSGALQIRCIPAACARARGLASVGPRLSRFLTNRGKP